MSTGDNLKTVTMIADIMAKHLGRLFIQVLVFYATLGLGMMVTAAYTVRRLWQAKELRPARITVPVIR